MNDQHVGQLVFLRVYSGTLSASSGVLNSTRDRKERVGRLLRMHANKREEVEAIAAGDIAAAMGLKLTTTGDTLWDPDRPIVLESMTFPEPVIAVAIEPKTRADEEKLGVSLSRLALEDPTFRVTSDEETGQTLIHGMGELHLEIIVDRLLREFRVEANVGKPQVAYRETVRKHGEAQGRFVRQTGGRGQYGDVYIEVDPNEPGGGFVFENKIIGDLNSRRGRIVSMEARGSSQVIRANVPLGQMFGYATEMRSMTQGRATYTMQFSRYEEVPSAVAEEIMAKVAGKPAARAGAR